MVDEHTCKRRQGDDRSGEHCLDWWTLTRLYVRGEKGARQFTLVNEDVKSRGPMGRYDARFL